MLLLVLTALFLILLVLVQRGKGGGLSGAFGGMGGQSAFGTKAGDTFTKITIGVSSFWIVLCLISVAALSTTQDRLQPAGTTPPAAEGQDQAAPETEPKPAEQAPAPAADDAAEPAKPAESDE